MEGRTGPAQLGPVLGPVLGARNRSLARQFFGAPRTPNARAQRALGVPQAPLSGAQRRRTPKTRAQRARRRRRPYGGAQRRCTPKTRAQRARQRRAAPPQAADSRCANLNAIFGFALLPKSSKSGTNRLRRFSPVRSGASARFLPQGSTAHGRKGERLGEITGQGSRARGRRAASCGRCSLRRSPRSRRVSQAAARAFARRGGRTAAPSRARSAAARCAGLARLGASENGHGRLLSPLPSA